MSLALPSFSAASPPMARAAIGTELAPTVGDGAGGVVLGVIPALPAD
jgi:hypothetical protein